MNAFLRAAIDSGLATIERVVDSPTGDLGYGTDIAWTLDMLEPMDDVDPTSTDAIAQAVVRRLDCPRGRLADDPDYGIDLVGRLNRGVTPAETNTLAGAIRNEIEKDDRILSATVVVVPTLSTLSVRIRIVPARADRGPFSLTFAVTTASLLLQEISR